MKPGPCVSGCWTAARMNTLLAACAVQCHSSCTWECLVHGVLHTQAFKCEIVVVQRSTHVDLHASCRAGAQLVQQSGALDSSTP
jgi:hypothetical protein